MVPVMEDVLVPEVFEGLPVTMGVQPGTFEASLLGIRSLFQLIHLSSGDHVIGWGV